MRVEPYAVGSVLHVVKRGARGMEIARDDADRWRFLKLLYLLNDEYQDINSARDANKLKPFERPPHWPERKPLVSVLAWTLMPNHFHLLLRETRAGGVTKFMQRLGASMTMHFNEKYGEQGSIFQGAFKSRTVNSDEYLRYAVAYIVVKNVFELYPGGLAKAIKEFDSTWKWAYAYPFSSFRAAANGNHSPLIDMGAVNELDLYGSSFRRSAHDMLSSFAERNFPEEVTLE